MRFRSFLPTVLSFLLTLMLPAIIVTPRLALSQSSRSDVSTGDAVISVFWREECGHCKREKEFLSDLQRQMPLLRIDWYNVADPEESKVFDAFTEMHNLPRVTPITIVGLRFIVGFDSPETTGEEIRWLLETEQTNVTVTELLGMGAEEGGWGEGTCPEDHPSTPHKAQPTELRYITVPLLGRIDIAGFTLPMLSLVLGMVDGFNPCAMWVLVAFLTALAQVGSLNKMIQFAGIFIVAQGIMYLLILNSWFIAFDFIRADRIVTPIIGIVAIGGGIFFLWEAAKSGGTCKITNFEKRAQTTSRIDALSKRALTPITVLSILGIALSVNVVEFACSIGIPQAYTKILDINHLGFWRRESLMGIYIFFYMLDDLLVFALAIWSIEKIGLTAKYSRWSNLVGGIIMLVLGVLLIAAPEKLRF